MTHSTRIVACISTGFLPNKTAEAIKYTFATQTESAIILASGTIDKIGLWDCAATSLVTKESKAFHLAVTDLSQEFTF